ncbi:hypothetical protein GCM10023097_11750 [Streptomyces collinus]
MDVAEFSAVLSWDRADAWAASVVTSEASGVPETGWRSPLGGGVTVGAADALDCRGAGKCVFTFVRTEGAPAERRSPFQRWFSANGTCVRGALAARPIRSCVLTRTDPVNG